MGRSGYTDSFGEEDNLVLGRWRGRVASAMRGRRGQRFFRELIAALEAMPKKELTTGVLEDRETGEVCALGAMGKARDMDMTDDDPEDHDRLGAIFDVAPCLIQECEFENDENMFWNSNAPGELEQVSRWAGMLNWAKSHLKEA